MGERTISMTLAFDPEGEVAGLLPGESAPRLRVFPSKHVASVRRVVEVDAEAREAVRVEWVGCEETVDSSRAALAIQLVCSQRIEEPVLEKTRRSYSRGEPIGEALVSLGELIREGREGKKVLAKIKDSSRSPPLLRLSTLISVVRFEASGGVRISRAPFSSDGLARTRRRCADVVSRWASFYDKAEPDAPELWNIHVPRYPTFGSKDLPAAFYRCVRPAERMHASFAEKLLTISAESEGWTVEDLVEALRKQRESSDEYRSETNVAARIVGAAASQTAWSMDYVNDHSGTVDVERMFQAREYSGDDCEGLGEESAMVSDDLGDLDLDDDDGTSRRRLLLEEVGRFLKRYDFVMTTVEATSPSAKGGGGDEGEKDEIICHVNTFGVPRAHLVEILPEEDARVMRAAFDPPLEPWEEGLPVITLEGTAPCNPLLLPALCYVAPDERDDLARRIVEQEMARVEIEREHPALSELVLRMQQPRFDADPSDLTEKTGSSFFRRVVGAWVDLRRYGIRRHLDFSVGYRDPESGAHRYGVTFVDWISKALRSNDGRTVELVPIYELDEEDWSACEEILRYSYPVKQWVVPPPLASEPKELRALGRKAKRPPSGKLPPFPPFVSYRVNRLEKIPLELAETVAKISRSGAARFETALHRFSEELYFVELRMFPKVEPSTAARAEAFIRARRTQKVGSSAARGKMKPSEGKMLF